MPRLVGGLWENGCEVKETGRNTEHSVQVLFARLS